MDYIDNHLKIGYLLAATGSFIWMKQIILALALGFLGALGAWTFDQIRKFVTKKLAERKERRILNKNI